MTNRDPNVPDFIRKLNDVYDCYRDYFKISSSEKLINDKTKQDIDLVCFFEISEVRKHIRNHQGLNYIDFVKVGPKEEEKYLKKFNSNKL
jgi:hypothetical protein